MILWKQKKQGFTLIELLAVIAILAVIMLIAIPSVLRLVDDAKKGAFKSSASAIVKAAENVNSRKTAVGEEFEEVTFTYNNGKETSSKPGYSLDYKGSKPNSGKIVVDTQGRVKMAIHDGTYCAEKDFDTTEVTVSDKKASECTF